MINSQVQSKIKNLDDLSSIIAGLKSQGKTVVHCHGVFDLLHPGHIRHFQAARKEGDVLVVTLTKDMYVGKGPGRPVFNEQLRAESIAALEAVDYVAINEWPIAVETIRKLKPSIYCKGSEYADEKEDLTGKIRDEKDAVESVGGRVVFTNEITFSSTKLINTHFEVFPEETQQYLNEFRGKYSARDVLKRLDTIKTTSVLVVGDSIIDEYHYCRPMGKSAKEILIPVQYLYEDISAGGILAIANHSAGFCDHVDIVTCLGTQNNYREFIAQKLKANVGSQFYLRSDAPTIVKRRYVEADFFRKLFEVYFMDGKVLPENISREVCDYLRTNLKKYDLVIVADYGHGFIDSDIIKTISDNAKFIALNVQTNSANAGFNLVTKYPRADFISINEPEIRLATHDNTSRIESLVPKIASQLSCNRIMVTRGHRGSMYFAGGHNFFSAPAFSKEIVDRVGAGDAFLSVASLCAVNAFPPDLIPFVGNAVGALAIRIVGNKQSIEPVALSKYINTLLK